MKTNYENFRKDKVALADFIGEFGIVIDCDECPIHSFCETEEGKQCPTCQDTILKWLDKPLEEKGE